jgi:hypothetical protein
VSSESLDELLEDDDDLLSFELLDEESDESDDEDLLCFESLDDESDESDDLLSFDLLDEDDFDLLDEDDFLPSVSKCPEPYH